MKKLLFIPLLILLSVSGAFGMDSANMLLAEVDTSKMIAMHPAFLEMIGGGGSSCPSWYASCIFSWDGDHDSGTNYACDSSGNAIEGTNSGLQIDTDNGESGSNGALIDAVNEYLTWTDSGDQYIDDDAPQTIWMRIYVSESLDNVTSILESTYDGDNKIYMAVHINDETFGYYEGQNDGGSTAYTNAITAALGTWIDVAFSWDTPAGEGTPTGECSANYGGWKEDLNDLGYVMSNNLNDITLGENDAASLGPPGVGKYVRVTQFAIVSGYETACPW